MKRIVRLFCLVTALLTLAGCFQVTTVVRVNPDGSGIVEERMLMSKKLLAQLNEFVSAFAEEGAEPPKPVELFEPEKLRQAAKGMGEGVSFATARKLTTADFEGYEAEYAFTDINKLRLNQKSSPPLPSAREGEKSAPLTFSFTRGNPATLIVRQQDAPAATATAAPPSPQEQAAKPEGAPGAPQLKGAEEMFRGLRVALAIEVNGTITKTNATHRDGSRVTIIDLDWDKLAGGAEQLAGLGLGAQGGDISLDQAKKLFKNVPGVKVDLNQELRVEFAGK